MIMRGDIATLWSLRDNNYSVMCVQHDHDPKERKKFLGETQSKYGKKNWSSMMLFNTPKCTALDIEYVNTRSGLELHQFKWLDNDNLIGNIDKSWNHLVGYQHDDDNPNLVHYTLGGPYFDDYHDCAYSDEWRQEYKNLSQPLSQK